MLTDFYEVVSEARGAASVEVRIRLNEAHPVYAGHFPNRPVMPGVCMLQIVKELLEKVAQEPLRMDSARNMKFLTVVDPNVQREVSIRIDFIRTEPGWQLEAKLFDNATTFFKLEGSIFSSCA